MILLGEPGARTISLYLPWNRESSSREWLWLSETAHSSYLVPFYAAHQRPLWVEESLVE